MPIGLGGSVPKKSFIVLVTLAIAGVSPIIGDHMVLQRETRNAIWGSSQPGDTVRVEVGGNSATEGRLDSSRRRKHIDSMLV